MKHGNNKRNAGEKALIILGYFAGCICIALLGFFIGYFAATF